jgi:hypothetical protein
LNSPAAKLFAHLGNQLEDASMQDKKVGPQLYRRAEEVREIAKGLFDRAEREIVMQFVEEAEKLVMPEASER